MTESIRWGILSTGDIARRMAETLAARPESTLLAVASRTQAAAEAFAAPRGIPRAYGTYAALAADPEVDIVYVATPHQLHAENTLMLIEAGKHVLVEKPFALNAAQGQRMVDAARANRRFLMEAMWTRFFPIHQKIRDLIASGAIGELRTLHAEFGWNATGDTRARFFDPALAGGALLDVGVYCIALAFDLFGAPARVESLAALTPSGVDGQSAYLFGYPNGAMAVLWSSLVSARHVRARISGTTGLIDVDYPWYKPTHFTLTRADQPPQIIEHPWDGTGQQYEVAASEAAIRAGQIEAALMSHDHSLGMLRVMDQMRAAWSLHYPGEG